eukprot:scaffold482_cov266-Amphora_coffeaeformis.AAC.23
MCPSGGCQAVINKQRRAATSTIRTESALRSSYQGILRTYCQGVGLRERFASGMPGLSLGRVHAGIQGKGRQQSLCRHVGRTGHPCASGDATGSGNPRADPATAYAHGGTSFLEQAKVNNVIALSVLDVSLGNGRLLICKLAAW